MRKFTILALLVAGLIGLSANKCEVTNYGEQGEEDQQQEEME